LINFIQWFGRYIADHWFHGSAYLFGSGSLELKCRGSSGLESGSQAQHKAYTSWWSFVCKLLMRDWWSKKGIGMIGRMNEGWINKWTSWHYAWQPNSPRWLITICILENILSSYCDPPLSLLLIHLHSFKCLVGVLVH